MSKATAGAARASCAQAAGIEVTTASVRCDRCGEHEATYFAEFEEVADVDYAADTGSAVYGWWGDVCPACLEQLKNRPGLLWLEAVDEADAVPVPIDGWSGWCDRQPDWAKAVVRVGSRIPSPEVP